METPSSTSSSEPVARWLPWGLIGAVLLLGAVELALRSSRPTGEPSYASSAQEYRVLPYELKARGAAMISLLGSSRGREGVSVPKLRESLGEALPAGQNVANYSLTAGRAMDVAEVVDRLVRAEPPPKLVLYGVSPRQLTAKRYPHTGRSNFWTLRDWWQIRRTDGAVVDRQLGGATRYSLGHALQLFRLEPEVRASLALKEGRWEHLRGTLTVVRGHHRSAMRGNKTLWQQGTPWKVRKVTKKRARSYLKNVTQHEPLVLSQEMLDAMERALATLTANGIDVVLFEMPLHPILESVYPKTVMPDFDRMMGELSARTGVAYLSAEALDYKFRRQDYREQSHMNLRGAEKISKGLAEAVVLPWLRGEGPAVRTR